jgi:hypothetical protein
MDRRRWTVICAATGVVLILVCISILLLNKRQADLHAQAAQAKYARIQNAYARASDAMDQLRKATLAYEVEQRQAIADSQERHRLWNESPNDLADALTSVRAEQEDVQRLGGLAESKASAARSAATALGAYFGDATLNPLLNDITSASDSELKYLADWNRAAYAVNDVLTARVNGRWGVAQTAEDIESLYRASNEDMAVSTSRWSGVASRLGDLQSRLRSDVLGAQPNESAPVAAASETPTPTSAPSSPTPIIAPTWTVSPPPVTAAPSSASAAPTTSTQVASVRPEGPLARNNVLPLLRATAALTVSSNPDGHTAYVTVPDTPANGTADANRIVSGQLADGRWVVFIPLASGSASVGDIYSLMWVWTDGHAQFVGEIPAENGGLGQLSTLVRDGEIYISWPVCCPKATRMKILTLDGIRLRPLSDQTS